MTTNINRGSIVLLVLLQLQLLLIMMIIEIMIISGIVQFVVVVEILYISLKVAVDAFQPEASIF